MSLRDLHARVTPLTIMGLTLAALSVGLASAQSYSPFPNGVQAAAVVPHASGGSRLIVAPETPGPPGPNTSAVLCSVEDGGWETCGAGLPYPQSITALVNVIGGEGQPPRLIASTWGHEVVYHSEDGGKTFAPSALTGPDYWISIYSIATSPAGALYGSGHGGQVFKSEDGGGVWMASGLAPFGIREGVETPDSRWQLISHPSIEGTLFGHISGKGVYVSKDDGGTWEQVGSNLPTSEVARDIGFSPLSDTVLFAATEQGVWRIALSAEGTAIEAWEMMPMAGADSVSVTRLQFSKPGGETPAGSLLIGTRDDGAWLSLDPLADDAQPLNCVPTAGSHITTIMALDGGGFFVGTWRNGTELILGGVFSTARAETLVIPQSIQLDQNYPNPFNPTTTITFLLGEPGRASLQVLDLLGREVARPVAGLLPAGRHAISIDASEWPSGIYAYRLSAGSQTVAKMLHLIR